MANRQDKDKIYVNYVHEAYLSDKKSNKEEKEHQESE